MKTIGSAVEMLTMALEAAKMAEAWPDDACIQAAARCRLVEAHEWALPELDAAYARANAKPVQRLSLDRLSSNVESYLVSEAVGDRIAERVSSATWWPRRLWRIDWIPQSRGEWMGSVVAWFANEFKVRNMAVPDIAVGRGMTMWCGSFTMSQEIQFQLRRMFGRLMLFAEVGTFNDHPAFHLHPYGRGSIECARRLAAVVGEERWRAARIDGVHPSWDDVMAAGGPIRGER